VEGIIREIREKSPINVYERSVRNVLGAIISSSDFWKIVDLSEEPLPLVADVIEILEKKGYVKIKDKITLTEKGRELVEKYKITSVRKFLCRFCSGRGISTEDFKDILEDFKRIVKNRPLPRQEFDQAFVTPETVVARVAFMTSRNDVENKEILVIGDDDLTSVALMLSRLPKKITIIDIDKRLTDFIEEVSREIGYEKIVGG